MKIVVYHAYYGCDTGCCGHTIEVEEAPHPRFRFTHPYGGDHRAFAEDLIREEMGDEHVADLDWDNSYICDD